MFRKYLLWWYWQRKSHFYSSNLWKLKRYTESKRLGAKLSDGQFATAGSIIYRQRGTKVHPGNNVGLGKDDTLFCMIDGIVKYERKGKDKKQVSVYPVE